MYTLFHKKSECKIEVKKAGRGMSHVHFTEEVSCYNDCYYVCLKRKPLVEKAREIKASWIKELEEKMDKVESIKI